MKRKRKKINKRNENSNIQNLIIYGTADGHTRKISRFTEEVLQDVPHQFLIASAKKDPPSPANYDLVFIGT